MDNRWDIHDLLMSGKLKRAEVMLMERLVWADYMQLWSINQCHLIDRVYFKKKWFVAVAHQNTIVPGFKRMIMPPALPS